MKKVTIVFYKFVKNIYESKKFLNGKSAYNLTINNIFSPSYYKNGNN